MQWRHDPDVSTYEVLAANLSADEQIDIIERVNVQLGKARRIIAEDINRALRREDGKKRDTSTLGWPQPAREAVAPHDDLAPALDELDLEDDGAYEMQSDDELPAGADDPVEEALAAFVQ